MYLQKIAAHAFLSVVLMSSTISHTMSGKEQIMVCVSVVGTAAVIGIGLAVIHRNNVMVDKAEFEKMKNFWNEQNQSYDRNDGDNDYSGSDDESTVNHRPRGWFNIFRRK